LMSPDRAVLFRFIHSINASASQETITIEQPPTEEVRQPVQQPEAITLVEPVVVVPTEIEQPIIAEELTTEAPVVIEETAIPEPIVQPEVTEPLHIPAAEPVAEVKLGGELPITSQGSRPETAVNPSETHSFAEWLLMQQEQKIVLDPLSAPKEEPVVVIQEAVEPAIELTAEPQESPSMQDEIAQQVIRSNVNEFESVLDKFIRENPRISRGKAEFYNPVNMAKQSVEDNDEIVTETLANVYYKQGHYKKAIRVYEKLCLIYPHKMPYFASLIQKIKTENKD
jgi:hypothetical protein